MEISSVFLCIILVVSGQCIGWLMASYKKEKNRIKQLSEREEIIAELSAAKQEILLNENWRQKYELLCNEVDRLRDRNTCLQADLREVTTQLKSTKIHSENQIYQIKNNEKYLSEQFENIAHRVFEQTNRSLENQNHQNLNHILTPLREQIDNFRRQIQDGFSQEMRERHILTHEIRNLKELNTQIAQEAINLTRALKGNNKVQGNWGEVVLTRVLETSGLRLGYEYETQVSIETDTNKRLQPDVIIRLPQGKNVVIDAKVTLVSYERYFNAEDESTKSSALQDHITSVRNHIRQLGCKDYQKLPGISTLDYVLMFIPIEPAFLLTIDKQPDLITEALHHNIIIVSPTTLLVALRTISNLWRFENQNRNTQKIAERASKLYDKIRLLIDDLSYIGQNIKRIQDSYCQSMKKLTSGRGNLISQIESFRSLGVEIKREINLETIEQVITQNEGGLYSFCDDRRSFSKHEKKLP